jgi:hypothetical protein
VLIHLKASSDAIRGRMKAEPREFVLIKEKDIQHVLHRFA